VIFSKLNIIADEKDLVIEFQPKIYALSHSQHWNSTLKIIEFPFFSGNLIMSTEYVFGCHAVQSLLQHQPQQVLEIWLDKQRHDARLQQIEQLARQTGLKIQKAPRNTLDKFANGGNHQGVVIRSKIPPALQEADLPDFLAKLSAAPFLLVLDNVQDPHNLGACLRSAEAAGVHAIIIPKDRAAGLSATVRKVASGAAERVPVFQVTNLARALRLLQEHGIWLVGTDGTAERSLYAEKLNGALALVLGAEAEGLRRLTRETCDSLIKIPMQGQIESLNVSVAAAVCMFEAMRQRTAK
jgi:23S rRNA (guanosine2251-2'-O)-methyltransferase